MDKSVTQLVDLAEKVGGEAWPHLVSGTWMMGWIALAGFSILVAIGISGFCVGSHMKKEGSDEYYIPVAVGIVLIAFGGFGLFLEAFPSIINPEYVILKSLLR